MAGFTLPGGHLGISFEAGYPVAALQVSYGFHDVFQLGVAYRTLWGMTHAPLGVARLRLWRGRRRPAAVALTLAGGYNFVLAGNSDLHTAMTGGDAGFGEMSLSISAGRTNRAFTVDLGLRLGVVREQEVCLDDYYWDEYGNACNQVFRSGEAGVLPTAFLDIGFAYRINAYSSFFLAFGFDAFTVSDALVAAGRAKLGFLFDPAAPGRGRR